MKQPIKGDKKPLRKKKNTKPNVKKHPQYEYDGLKIGYKNPRATDAIPKIKVMKFRFFMAVLLFYFVLICFRSFLLYHKKITCILK